MIYEFRTYTFPAGQAPKYLNLVRDVWRRRDGEWKIWRRHSTPLAAGQLPGT